MKKPTPTPEQIHVGVFPLGFLNVDLFAVTTDNDGCFYFCPDKKSLPRIKVGIKREDWFHAVQILLHEAMEFELAMLRARYETTGVMGDHGGYLFSFSHSQFTDACEGVGSFMAAAMPHLSEVWRKHHAKAK